MKILVSGCSFTHWPDVPGSEKNICWPAHLHVDLPNIDITNVAEPGAGNYYISNSVTQAICNNPDIYDMVLVMWSGVSRLDFLTNLLDKDWHNLFDDYGFYRRVDSCPSTLGYIFSGGQMGPWFRHPASTPLFREMYKISSQLSLAYHNLLEMIKCQEFLKSKKIPYRFMSYVNYWTKENNISPNGDFGVFAFPELQSIINGIDFNNWIFFNDQKDGIYEIAKEADDYYGDRFHPGINVHRQWAKLVSDQLRAEYDQVHDGSNQSPS